MSPPLYSALVTWEQAQKTAQSTRLDPLQDYDLCNSTEEALAITAASKRKSRNASASKLKSCAPAFIGAGGRLGEAHLFDWRLFDDTKVWLAGFSLDTCYPELAMLNANERMNLTEQEISKFSM